MFFETGLAFLMIVVRADGSVETDHELAIARATFAREFPDDAKRVADVAIIDAEYEVTS